MQDVPKYTVEGFLKVKMPSWLFERVSEFQEQNYFSSVPERSDAIGTYITSSLTPAFPARFIPLSDEIKEEIAGYMIPMLERWVKHDLEFVALYGIREYRRGATLKMHVDRVETHHVSAIVNVSQYVRQEWPLHIYDHDGKLHKVYMQPGEIILYESARLMHGRPEPLDGISFANFFIHAKEKSNVQ